MPSACPPAMRRSVISWTEGPCQNPRKLSSSLSSFATFSHSLCVNFDGHKLCMMLCGGLYLGEALHSPNGDIAGGVTDLIRHRHMSRGHMTHHQNFPMRSLNSRTGQCYSISLIGAWSAP